MPLLAVFAEKDRQIDPVQGAEAYQQALARHRHALSEVVVIPGADHNLRQTETGCLQEQSKSYGQPGKAGYHPEFLHTLHTWLVKLKSNVFEANLA